VIEGLGDWPPLMVIVQGQDLDVLAREAERVKGILQSVAGSSDVRTNVNPGRPEMHVSIDRARAADMGVPSGLVAVSARLLVDGEIVGTLRDGGPEAEIRLRADPRYSALPEQVARLPLSTPRGTVSLGEIATVALASGASEINRNNRMRAITVSSQIADDGALGTIVDGFTKAIEANPLPEGYFWTIDGQARDMQETAAAMGLAMAVAFLFIFMVLASQYESLLHPFTLLVSVPLAMIGAILALAVTGSSISMGSQIGIILLMGLVTKNAILLVDGALVAMRSGADPVSAMMVAGPRRLRPIVMTSAAMVLGMLPTALGQGVGSEFRAPMGVSVIGGVISSTLLTLLVVPVAFVWMEGLRARAQAFWSRAGSAHPAPLVLEREEDAAK
jgi:multidrug efflux pump subunit AcrB